MSQAQQHPPQPRDTLPIPMYSIQLTNHITARLHPPHPQQRATCNSRNINNNSGTPSTKHCSALRISQSHHKAIGLSSEILLIPTTTRPSMQIAIRTYLWRSTQIFSQPRLDLHRPSSPDGSSPVSMSPICGPSLDSRARALDYNESVLLSRPVYLKALLSGRIVHLRFGN